jgi:hypothetical protein
MHATRVCGRRGVLEVMKERRSFVMMRLSFTAKVMALSASAQPEAERCLQQRMITAVG